MILGKGRGIGNYFSQYFDKKHPVAAIKYKHEVYHLIPFKSKYKHSWNPYVFRLYKLSKHARILDYNSEYIEFLSLKSSDHPVVNHFINEIKRIAKLKLSKAKYIHQQELEKGKILLPEIELIDYRNKMRMFVTVAFYRPKGSSRLIYAGWGFRGNNNSFKTIYVERSKFAAKNNIFLYYQVY